MALQIEPFHRDHEGLLVLATDVIRGASRDAALDDPGAARRTLHRFSVVLAAHIALEDRVVYPRLLDSSLDVVRSRARELHESFGTLHRDFLAFAEWWMEPDAIDSEPERYAVEVADVMRRIRLRVALETRELYPLLEAVDALDGA